MLWDAIAEPKAMRSRTAEAESVMSEAPSRLVYARRIRIDTQAQTTHRPQTTPKSATAAGGGRIRGLNRGENV